MADPDDIIRDIDEDDVDECQAEVNRLYKRKRGFLAAFTEIKNIIDNLITASRGDNGAVDKSEANRNALQRAREKLEIRYEKIQRMDNRLLTLESLCNDQKEVKEWLEQIDHHTQTYNKLIADLSKLNLDIQAQQNQAIVNDEEHHQHLKPIQALKPSFILSFDHSPTELAAWVLQFRSYFDASRLNALPVPQQQAFLRQGLNPDVWTAIKHKVNNETVVFRNPLNLEEDSFELFVEEAF